MPHFSFVSLPEELLLKILKSLEYSSVLNSAVTCRRLNTIIVNSIALQYKVQLAACGMRDGADSDLSLPERLERLKQLSMKPPGESSPGRSTAHFSILSDNPLLCWCQEAFLSFARTANYPQNRQDTSYSDYRLDYEEWKSGIGIS
ncbi:hypothetical protein BV25DRAFT_1916834 [Artomyces pyxidatus]|uniref:Uncharacterized protein n=1 Tax=Artomyces pyxidatus TaxID=48021 RepID=A0ACB8SZ60_9AGAM|nr:hypothetical protein BV25DRAFT_1916834 [Artomyces pyxidatus]